MYPQGSGPGRALTLQRSVLIVFGLLRNCTASLSARSWKLSRDVHGSCSARALGGQSRDAGFCGWALPSAGSGPPWGSAAARQQGWWGWLESKVQGKGAARGSQEEGVWDGRVLGRVPGWGSVGEGLPRSPRRRGQGMTEGSWGPRTGLYGVRVYGVLRVVIGWHSKGPPPGGGREVKGWFDGSEVGVQAGGFREFQSEDLRR